MNSDSRKKIKVIYCMGSGRSGSTLFGIIMGNHPMIINPGEINNINGLKKKKFNCSCGERVEDCEFWSEVYSNWTQKNTEEQTTAVFSKIGKYENFKSPFAWLRATLIYKFRPTIEIIC